MPAAFTWCPTEFLAQVQPLGVEVDYIVLRAPLAETLRRAMSRPEAKPAHEEIVRHMHPEFADLGTLEPHAIDTSNQPAAMTLDLVASQRSKGQFLLVRHGSAT